MGKDEARDRTNRISGMQGNLSEIDARSLLQLIDINQRTGELFIETGDGRFWSLFFQKGCLVYATSNLGAVDRLKHCAQRFSLGEASFTCTPGPAPASAPEYGLVVALAQNRTLSPAQVQQLLRAGAEEIVFDLLLLQNGAFIFEADAALQPVFIQIETGALITQVSKRLAEWQKLSPVVQSTEQRPLILDADQLQKQLPAPIYAQLRQWMTGDNSLRLLARFLGRDSATLARAIAPYLQQGWIRLEGEIPRKKSTPASQSSTTRVQRVACVDDSISIQKSVEFFLQGRGYDVKTIANPLKALNELFSFKPDLILLDIAMPRLDGYELCGMLRKSNIFKLTPVIMLTGKDGHVDRVRARMAGATEYLTKPFGERELLDLVDKYLAPQGALSMAPHA